MTSTVIMIASARWVGIIPPHSTVEGTRTILPLAKVCLLPKSCVDATISVTFPWLGYATLPISNCKFFETYSTCRKKDSIESMHGHQCGKTYWRRRRTRFTSWRTAVEEKKNQQPFMVVSTLSVPVRNGRPAEHSRDLTKTLQGGSHVSEAG